MAFYESWSVGVFIRATSNAARMFTETGNAASRANTVIGTHNSLLRTTAQRQAALRNQIALTNQIAGVASMAFKGLAVASGAAIFTGVKGAAELQSAMTNVAIATHTATDKMGAFYAMAFRMSGMTAQSVSTIAQEMATAASSGLGNPRQLMAAFPAMAKAADVLWLSPKHLDPVDSIRQMATLSHLFGMYSGPGYQHMLDRAVQMMYVQPESLQALLTQGRQFIGPALARGVTEDDIFKMAMTMGQTGFLRSRGGSEIARVIEYLSGAATITGHLSRAQHAAMEKLGLTDARGVLDKQYEDSRGDLLLGKVVDHLEQIRKNFSPMEFGNLLSNAFLAQGGRFMATILLPSVFAQSQKNWRQMNLVGNVQSMWRTYTGNFIYQWNVFATNFQNLMKTIFMPLLPRMTKMLRDWGASLANAVAYLSQHPKVAGMIGKGMFTVFAASLAGIIATSIIAAANVWRLNSALAALSVTSGMRTAGIAGEAVAGSGGAGIVARIVGRLRTILGLGAPLATTGGVYPEVAGLAQRGILARIVGGVGSKLIPIVGWVLAAVTAISGLTTLIRNSPQIATAIHNWWVKNQYQIGYTIGSAFAAIGKMLQSAIMGLFSSAWAAIRTTAFNFWELTSPAGQVTLAQQIAIAQMQAQKQWLAGPGTQTFGSGFYSGWNNVFAPSAAGHQGPVVNMYINDPNFHFPNGTNPDHARESAGQMFDELLKRAQHASATHGVHEPVTPFSAPFAFE